MIFNRMKASKLNKIGSTPFAFPSPAPPPDLNGKYAMGMRPRKVAEAGLGRTADFPAPPSFPRACARFDRSGFFAPGPDLGVRLKELEDRWIASEGQLRREELIKSIT